MAWRSIRVCAAAAALVGSCAGALARQAPPAPARQAPPAPAVPALLIEDFENTPLGARPFQWKDVKPAGVKATVGVEKAVIDDNDANRGLQFEYQFPTSYAAGQAVEASVPAQPLPGSLTAVTAMVYGDGSKNLVALRVSDRQGEQFEWQAPFKGAEWTLASFPLNPAAAQRSGAPGNGKPDPPLKLEAVRLVRSPQGAARGQIVVDTLTALCRFGKVTTLYDTVGGVKTDGWRAVRSRAVKGEVGESLVPRYGKDVPALRLEYEYEPSGDASVEFARTLQAGAGHGTLVADLFGDGSNNLLRLRMVDGDGRLWQAPAPVLVDWAGWKTVYFDTRGLRDAQGRDPTAVVQKFPISFYSLVVDDVSARDQLPGVESGRKGEIYLGRLLFCSEQ